MSTTRTPEQKAQAAEAKRRQRAAKKAKEETMGTVTPAAGLAISNMEKARAARRSGIQTNQAGDITREVIPGPIDAEHLAKHPLSPAGGTKVVTGAQAEAEVLEALAGEAQTDRLTRITVAKAEAKTVTAWKKAGSKGKAPTTPNLDAMRAEAKGEAKGEAKAAKAGSTTRLDDGTVTVWIANYRAADPKAGQAAGLAAFRATGQSCNQARFRTLWQATPATTVEAGAK